MVGGAYERSAAGRLGSDFYATRITPGHRKRGHVPLCQDQVRHQGQPLLVELEG